MSSPQFARAFSSLSLRDPDGAVIRVPGRVYRFIRDSAASQARDFLEVINHLQLERGRFVRSWIAAESRDAQLLHDADLRAFRDRADFGILVEHEAVPFPAFPGEWPAAMLQAAASLTLEIAEKLLPRGLGLKDATPYNVLFDGNQPVFIDLLSVESRNPRDPVWLPQAQFVRSFLLPLFAHLRFGLRLDQIFASHRDGLEPHEVYRLCGPVDKLLPPALTLASMPTWLSGRAESSGEALYEKTPTTEPDKAQFILRSMFARLRANVDRLGTRGRISSAWTSYEESRPSYSAEEYEAKDEFVRDTLAQVKAERVLDVGCNTGHFSLLAARAGARVIAIDSDEAVIENLWRTARAQKVNVLPLVVNLARPTPSAGWRNSECPSFLERARDSFDMVLMLAVLHHILVTEGIPLAEIIDLAAELTTRSCILEFIAPGDPMFRKLLRGRKHLYDGLTAAAFEQLCAARFDIVASRRLGSAERWIYHLQKKA